MLGFGRAAREVCALALRRGVCFCHFVAVKYECDDYRLFCFATQKALRGARTWMVRQRKSLPDKESLSSDALLHARSQGDTTYRLVTSIR